MSAIAIPERPRGLALMLGWRRLRFTLAFSLALGLLLGIGWKSGLWSVVERTLALGLVAMLVFGLFEQWPRRLPRWLARWVLQVVGVAIAMPVATSASTCCRPTPARRRSGTSRIAWRASPS